VAESYRVFASTAFERDVRRLRKLRRGVYEALVRAVEVLESD
jgi:hypothetical protein